MIRQGDAVFVDSAAWIALALPRDPLHGQAREQWGLLQRAGAKLHTSVPVIIETFTFLDRNANRDVALLWKDCIYKRGTVKILPSELRDLEQSWEYGSAQAIGRRCNELCNYEARTNFEIAYTFDHHFAVVGFRLVA